MKTNLVSVKNKDAYAWKDNKLVSAWNKIVDAVTWMKTKLVCGKNNMVDAYTWVKPN